MKIANWQGVNKLVFKLVLLILFVVLILLQYRLWFANGNILETRQLQLSLEKQLSVNDQQELQNRQLRSEIDALKTDLSEVEARARKELGMIKPGEIFYMLVQQSGAQPDNKARAD